MRQPKHLSSTEIELIGHLLRKKTRGSSKSILANLTTYMSTSLDTQNFVNEDNGDMKASIIKDMLTPNPTN